MGGDDLDALGDKESALDEGVKRLIAVAEDYPDLKANENFLNLQEELAETENYIQFARRFYNGSVRQVQYDRRIRSEQYRRRVVFVQAACVLSEGVGRRGQRSPREPGVGGMNKHWLALLSRCRSGPSLTSAFVIITATFSSEPTAGSKSPRPLRSGQKGGRSGAASSASIRRSTGTIAAIDSSRYTSRGRLPGTVTPNSCVPKSPATGSGPISAAAIAPIPTGEHTYVYRYDAGRMLGFFDDNDELWWNVTGDDWDFPIDRASAAVRFDFDVPVDQVTMDAWQGSFGSTERATTLQDDGFRFETTRSLAVGEGFSILIAWPKGLVDEPSDVQRLIWLLTDNLNLLVALAGLAAMLGYYMPVWRNYGKDPAPGVVFTRYEPPAGFSPASLRYIANMNYDDETMTSGVISLAVKGFLHIDKDDDEHTLRKSEAGASTLLRSPPVSALFSMHCSRMAIRSRCLMIITKYWVRPGRHMRHRSNATTTIAISSRTGC